MNGHDDLPVQERAPAKTILIVEDDADVGEFFVQAVQQETPYQSLLAADGFQALKMLRSLKPDLLVLDYLLPGMNGLEIYDQLRAMPGFETIPVLFISANAPTGELQKRCVYFLRKPFELEALLQTIEDLLAEE
jgi:CheY-like chemotaxis protein